MSSDCARAPAIRLALAVALVSGYVLVDAQARRTTPVFYPDDPIAADDDTAFDASGMKEVDLSETFDFLQNTFALPGDRTPIRAENVNTIDEVPDSSWFTNRIGARDMPIEEIVRGPNKFPRLDADEWTIVRGKGPNGFQPGFRAVHARDPEQVYQLEVDPPSNPQLATGAEFIGTLIYHALGYNVVDVYTLKVDADKIRISDKATIRDASGERKFTKNDLRAILRQGARDRDGRYYMSAARFEEGEDLGRFEYYGTRSDDPNDIYPHEHRRELRANRVFAAWLAHDDSRAVNTLNMRVKESGKTFIRHYMYDFGAILGSSTRFAEPPVSNHEYYIEKDASVKSLLTLGLAVPSYLRAKRPSDVPPSVGHLDIDIFDPVRWKANYPNPAFSNMRADDAFWGARLVSRFTDAHLRAIVEAARFDDPAATDYLTRALIARRNAVTRAWLNGVNPIVNVTLAADGTLRFENAAIAAGAATPRASYSVRWARFDNTTGTLTPEGGETSSQEPRLSAPGAILARSEFVAALIRAEHPEHPAWQWPVQVYFRRSADGWKTVGLFRDVGPEVHSTSRR
jgi:hypothetical protein